MITINSDMMSRPQPSSHYLQVRHDLSNDYVDVSIVVQAFGRLDKTKNCIESILKYTDIDYELILLDNGTPENDLVEYFEQIDYPRKEIIKFTKNITGVYAVNKTLHMFASKYIVWVNNDIIVTKNWLNNLLTCVESDEQIGIVVPKSSNISNFQVETLGGFKGLEEMQVKAAAFNISDPAKWEERIRLIPSATLYRREIFDVVGMYDNGFMHDFGDDDFTFRVRRAGYKLMVCGDTFVHHDHDQNALPQERVEIMQQSRNFFKEKYHGIDAWEDTVNYILEPLKNVKFSDKEKKSILALDVKCGTPILDVKNHLRKNNIGVAQCKAYTTDAKYLIDLQGMSEEVVCGDIEQTINCECGKYDIIVLGTPLNAYNKPLELIRKLAQLKKENGYIIFSMKNTNSITTFLKMTGAWPRRNMDYSRDMYYNDVFSELTKHDVTKGEITCKNHNVDQNLLGSVFDMIKAMNLGEKQGEVIQHLMVDEYMITAF